MERNEEDHHGHKHPNMGGRREQGVGLEAGPEVGGRLHERRCWDLSRASMEGWTTKGWTTMTTRRMGKVTKAMLTVEPLKVMGHIMKLTQPAQDGVLGEGQRPMMGHVKMMAKLGGLEVGLVVGTELMMSRQIWINMKP